MFEWYRVVLSSFSLHLKPLHEILYTLVDFLTRRHLPGTVHFREVRFHCSLSHVSEQQIECNSLSANQCLVRLIKPQ